MKLLCLLALLVTIEAKLGLLLREKALYVDNPAPKPAASKPAALKLAATKPVKPDPKNYSDNLFSCDFDKDICGMLQPSASISWTRIEGKTPSGNTGPSTGKYIYIEASNNRGKKATITTPGLAVTSLGSYALRFKYHMYGTTMGTLNVFYTGTTHKKQTTFFSHTGDGGNTWHEICRDIIIPVAGTYKVGFVGVVGSGFRSDMALDDVTIVRGSCVTKISSNATLPVQKPVPGKVLLSCTFDKDNCNLVNSSNSKFVWLRRRGPTGSARTGPTTDAKGSPLGGYLYTEASNYQLDKNNKATLLTAEYSINGEGCLEFSYHMYGDGMGVFKVSTEIEGVRAVVFSMSGNKGNRWFRAQISLAATPKIKFVFDALRGSSFTSDMAIDDILLKDDKCGSLLTRRDRQQSMSYN